MYAKIYFSMQKSTKDDFIQNSDYYIQKWNYLIQKSVYYI